MFAVGVGEAEPTELLQIASRPISKYVFSVADYAAIASIQDSLTKQVCFDVGGNFKGKIIFV